MIQTNYTSTSTSEPFVQSEQLKKRKQLKLQLDRKIDILEDQVEKYNAKVLQAQIFMDAVFGADAPSINEDRDLIETERFVSKIYFKRTVMLDLLEQKLFRANYRLEELMLGIWEEEDAMLKENKKRFLFF